MNEKIEESAAHWDALAAEQDRWADYATSRGEYPGVHQAKAQTYRRTAEALRLEHATGIPHCSCCLKARK